MYIYIYIYIHTYMNTNCLPNWNSAMFLFCNGLMNMFEAFFGLPSLDNGTAQICDIHEEY